MSTIVVGGYKISTTELLDDGDDTWRMGPRMPWQLWDHGLVEDPRGGIILIAGSTEVYGATDNLFTATKMQIQIQTGKKIHKLWKKG